jgi:hypothetical protein
MYFKKLYLYYLKKLFYQKKLFKIASLIGNPTRGIEWAANYCKGTIRRGPETNKARQGFYSLRMTCPFHLRDTKSGLVMIWVLYSLIFLILVLLLFIVFNSTSSNAYCCSHFILSWSSKRLTDPAVNHTIFCIFCFN